MNQSFSFSFARQCVWKGLVSATAIGFVIVCSMPAVLAQDPSGFPEIRPTDPGSKVIEIVPGQKSLGIESIPRAIDSMQDAGMKADNVAGKSQATPADNAKEQDAQAAFSKLGFRELTLKIRENSSEIDKLYVTVPLGFPERKIQFQRRIEWLERENEKLREYVQPAAVAAFRANPAGSRAAAKKVFELLASKLSPRDRTLHFDPRGAYELVKTVLEIKGTAIGMEPGKRPDPAEQPLVDVIFQGYLACYSLQEFAEAEEFLVRLENMDIGLKPTIREKFEETWAAWQIEKSLRDASDQRADLPRVKFETSVGTFEVELFEDHAPNTVANFIELVDSGFYDGLEFFNVVPRQFARTGCSENDGTTNPGYTIADEFENSRGNFMGTLAMQNDGENTAGSQFLIMHRPQIELNGKVTTFGRVLGEGMQMIYQLNTVDRLRKTGGDASTITKATVVFRRPGSQYKATKVQNVGAEVSAELRALGAEADGANATVRE